jgi:hypothetical protein
MRWRSHFAGNQERHCSVEVASNKGYRTAKKSPLTPADSLRWMGQLALYVEESTAFAIAWNDFACRCLETRPFENSKKFPRIFCFHLFPWFIFSATRRNRVDESFAQKDRAIISILHISGCRSNHLQPHLNGDRAEPNPPLKIFQTKGTPRILKWKSKWFWEFLPPLQSTLETWFVLKTYPWM